MPGPVVAALGGYQFEAHGFGMKSRRRHLDTQWGEVQIAGGLNEVQWTGGNSVTERIKGVLFPHEFGGMESLAGISAAALAGQPLPLVSLGDGSSQNSFGLYVVEALEEDHDYIDATGRPMENTYNINLRKFPGRSFSPVSVISSFF